MLYLCVEEHGSVKHYKRSEWYPSKAAPQVKVTRGMEWSISLK